MGVDCMIVILDWLLSNLFLHTLEEDWCRFGIDSGFHHRKWQNKSSIHPSRTTAHQLRMHKKKNVQREEICECFTEFLQK